MCHPEARGGSEPALEVVRQEVPIAVEGGQQMPCLLASPAGEAGGGILVVCDVYGRSPFYEDLAAKLAGSGWRALVPDHFFREGGLAERTREAAMERRGRLDENRTLRDLSSALEQLRELAGHGDRVGTIGFCMGGTLVLDLAAEHDDLATVCYYGFPAARAGATPRSAPAPLDLVDRIQGPLLGHWGELDEGVGMDNVERLRSALSERGIDFKFTVYGRVGHGFLAQPPIDEEDDAAMRSWAETLNFFRQHLAGAAR